MDERLLASYAYHNCEFARALAMARAAPADDHDAAAIRIKALAELDAKADAAASADDACARFPLRGELHYLRGMAYYLGGFPKSAIGEAFVTAAELGHGAASMGLAFLAFTEQRTNDAVALLEAAQPEDFELEHVRRLMLFQVLQAAGESHRAKDQLREADRLLSRLPSLLRHYWGQLCWVRHYRGAALFEAADALVERVLDQLDTAHMPRLYRNASEAQRMSRMRSAASNLILPTTGLAAGLREITRKPMLNSLYRYLRDQGEIGATKEDIVSRVWEERYNPLVHDDRIYKAVGRLRKLLGDDLSAPRYLTQAGRSYVLTLPELPEPTGGV